jgi:UDP-3-O-[3-hydroxymyristoyl] N-acetylglucosamine deacetylase
MMQATLRDALRFEGIGLHTGASASIEVQPAQPDEGLSFVVDGLRIPATVEHVVDTSRATVVGSDGVTISTTEHLLSALFALGVSNAAIRVSGPEIPALDGSALPFVSAIERCGVREQPQLRTTLELNETFAVQAADRMIVALPANEFRVRFLADFAPPIGTQYFAGEIGPDVYRREIAAARTFAYLHEIEALRARGLARGGNLDNALVFGPDGPLQPLRWPDEAVRHKVLDLVGDLALLGAWPHCEIVAIKSGHELHASLTRELRARLRVPSA